jgi:hypothetical protein
MTERQMADNVLISLAVSGDFDRIKGGQMPIEPLIHSHITDELPDAHPLAYKTVDCDKCDVMVHASNNECMQTWVESGKGNYCLACFVSLTDGVLEAEHALDGVEA